MDIDSEVLKLVRFLFADDSIDWRLRWFLIASGAAFLFLHKGLREEDSRAALVGWIRRGTYARRYQAAILWAFQVTDRWFLTRQKYDTLPIQSVARALPKRQFEISLALAFLYPLISFLIIQHGTGTLLVGDRDYTLQFTNLWDIDAYLIWTVLTFGVALAALFVRWPLVRLSLVFLAIVLAWVLWPFEERMGLTFAPEIFVFSSMTILLSVLVASAVLGTRFDLM